MDPAAEGLRRFIENTMDMRLAEAFAAYSVAEAVAAYREAIATPPQPELAPPGWITDRVPTAADAGSEDEVRVASRDKTGNAEDWIHWSLVHPGTPWASPGRNCPAPWDPTTLDRNGWIRSRLPTAGDSSNCLVKVPSRPGGGWFVFQDYALIVPGQPWAPISVTPGPYQP